MKKSILKIILSIVIVVAIMSAIFLYAFFLQGNSSDAPEKMKCNSQSTEMTISDSNTIDVVQKIDVKNCINKDTKTRFYVDVPFYDKWGYGLYSYDFLDLSSNLPEVISIDEIANQKIIFKISPSYRDNIEKYLDEINNIITIKYSINSKDILSYSKRYNSVILTLNNDIYFKNGNDFYLTLPDKCVTIMNKNLKYSKEAENTYKIDLKKLSSQTKVEIRNTMKCEISEYHNIDENNEYTFDLIKKIIIIMTSIIVIILVIAYLSKIVFIEKGEYERNTETVIDPISAEAIIDGKIDAKDLIMTCITNLIQKKNLEIMENGNIKLLNVDNVTDIEREILSLLFDDLTLRRMPELYIGKEIDFSNYKDKFKNNNEYTLLFYNRFYEIREIIKDKLIKHHIISKPWLTILKQVKIFAILLLINSFYFFSVSNDDIFFYALFLKYIVIIDIAIYFILLFNTPQEFITRKVRRKRLSTVFYLLVMVGFTFASFMRLPLTNKLFACTIVLINYFAYKLSNTFVLTKTGKIEFKKAKKLKNYLIDNSLISERGIDGVIIWDDYLVYATAFGIPSKVTSRIAENIMALNINLQIINKILSLY